MDKSAKHHAKYYLWIRRSQRCRKRYTFLHNTHQHWREINKLDFERRLNNILKIHYVACELLKRTYVPDASLNNAKQSWRLYHYTEDNLHTVWEQAKKIAL